MEMRKLASASAAATILLFVSCTTSSIVLPSTAAQNQLLPAATAQAMGANLTKQVAPCRRTVPTAASLSIAQFGPIGTHDDSIVFQKALDAAEARSLPLFIPAGATVNIRGTVYLGDVTLCARDATINAYIDADFRQRGTAARRKDGVILTKSAPGAGFGRATVRIAFDTLTINTIRTSDAVLPKAGLLLENIASFEGDTLTGSAQGTGGSEVDPFDFFFGVQGVRIKRVTVRMNNPGGHGGFWLRNFSPDRATADIRIGLVELSGASGDELFSIFNSGDGRADLHDIHIGTVDARPSGGGGMGLSIYRNAGGYDPARMQRIAIDQVRITVGDIGPLADTTGGFAFKVHACAPSIGSAWIRYMGRWTPKLPWVFGVRFVPGQGQTAPLSIPAITVQVSARNAVPARSAAMLYGPIVVDKLIVRGRGSGFRQIANGGVDLRAVDVASTAIQGDPFLGTRRVRGRINGRLVSFGD